MTRSIDRDVGRFKQILRGKVRENLRKYITHGEMIGRTGRELVSIPVPAIDIPHFRHGQKGSGGVGQGEGEVGQPVGKGQGQEGDGKGKAGDQPGAHIREVEISLEELADMLGEALELPDIQPKGKELAQEPQGQVHVDPPDGPRFAAALQADLQASPEAASDARQLQLRQPGRHSHAGRRAVSFVEDGDRARVERGRDLHHGCVRLDDRRPERDRPDRVASGSTRGSSGNTTACSAATSCTTRLPTKSTKTRFIAPAKAAARGSRRPTRSPGRSSPATFRPSDWNIYCFQFSDGDNWGEDNERLPEVRSRPTCSLRSTCSATDRWRAPTDRATISASCGKLSTSSTT